MFFGRADCSSGHLEPKHKLLLGAMVLFLAIVTLESALEIWNNPMTGDFQYFYYAAYGVVHDQDIYTAGYPFTGKHWYAYLPLFAISLSPIVWLGLGGAGAVWCVVNAGLIAACLFIAVREAVTRLGMKATPSLMIGVGFLVVLPLVDKIRTELRMGQSDAFVMIWMMLGLMWIGRRPILGGFMLGGSVNVKLQGLVFLPYLIARGRVKNLIGFVAGTVFFAMVGSLIWGVEQNMHYLGTVFGWVGDLIGVQSDQPAIESELMPLGWIRSVSIPSVLKRAQLQWGLSESVVLIGTAVLMGFIVAAGWALYALRGVPLFRGRGAAHDDGTARGRGLVGLEWAGLIVGMLIFSPQSTVRHFIMSMLVLAFGSAILHAGIDRKRKVVVGVVMGVYWASMVLPPGGEAFDPLVMKWRAIGGSMWALVALYMCVLWAGLGIVRGLPDEVPVSQNG